MHGRKPDADFGTGFRLPVAHSGTLKINRQENGRFPEALRLTNSGSRSMIAGRTADDCRLLHLRHQEAHQSHHRGARLNSKTIIGTLVLPTLAQRHEESGHLIKVENVIGMVIPERAERH
jgi:hypothetical protein